MRHTLALTTTAMVAFAANSLLCRGALLSTEIDPATFTSIRIASGAIALRVLLLFLPSNDPRNDSTSLRHAGSFVSAAALFAYAACFSFAYEGLSAATGALILFGAVQVTMIGFGLLRGERLAPLQWLGLAIAVAGLVALLLPGLTAPPLGSATLMMGAGIAWGVYSLRGRGVSEPTRETTGNFVRAVAFCIPLLLASFGIANVDTWGIVLAVCSGALASGAGYAIWYRALPGLGAAQAATVQLSVPVIAAIGGILLLAEAPTARLVLAGIPILTGIALVIRSKAPRLPALPRQ